MGRELRSSPTTLRRMLLGMTYVEVPDGQTPLSMVNPDQDSELKFLYFALPTGGCDKRTPSEYQITASLEDLTSLKEIGTSHETNPTSLCFALAISALILILGSRICGLRARIFYLYSARIPDSSLSVITFPMARRESHSKGIYVVRFNAA